MSECDYVVATEICVRERKNEHCDRREREFGKIIQKSENKLFSLNGSESERLYGILRMIFE